MLIIISCYGTVTVYISSEFQVQDEGSAKTDLIIALTASLLSIAIALSFLVLSSKHGFLASAKCKDTYEAGAIDSERLGMSIAAIVVLTVASILSIYALVDMYYTLKGSVADDQKIESLTVLALTCGCIGAAIAIASGGISIHNDQKSANKE